MTFPVRNKFGNIRQYSLNTRLIYIVKIFIVIFLSLCIVFLIYKFIPNPYLCYGYRPIKISKNPIEFDWTGNSYQCRFGIANSGILAVKNPILHLYFIDGATVSLDSENKEWQKNDDINYFWTKDVAISGGIHIIDYAERAWPIDVIFHKKGINRIKYIINSNGIQKKGEIRVINKH